MMKLKMIVSLVILVTLFGCSQTNQGPSQVAHEFYTKLVDLNIRGLPTSDQAKAIQPYLSKELNDKFAAAKKEQERFIEEAKKKGQILKAPWSGGNLFASNYEGMTSFSLGSPQISSKTASIPVYLECREDKNDNDPSQWIDIIILKQTDEGWKVNDLFLCAPWDFGFRGNLRGFLPDN